MRLTDGSMSVRMSYSAMRRLGALMRRMLLQDASVQLGVPVDTLTTAPGRVIHEASGRSLSREQLAPQVTGLPVPEPAIVKFRDRRSGKPTRRLDVYENSTRKVIYGANSRVEGMLQAAVQYAPRLGMTLGAIRNEDQVRKMRSVHSVHRLPGAVAVVAEGWRDAKGGAEAVQIDWMDPGSDANARYMPADVFATALGAQLPNADGDIHAKSLAA